jgi:hypothetical protein
LAFLSPDGQAFLDGPILNDTNATHTGSFPLFLGVGGDANTALTLRGTNTYGYGTVITNFGRPNEERQALTLRLGEARRDQRSRYYMNCRAA